MKDFTILTKRTPCALKIRPVIIPLLTAVILGGSWKPVCKAQKPEKSVSSAGKADVHIKYNGHYTPAEVKTNGGRIDSLIDGTNKSKFIIYIMEYVQRHKAGKRPKHGKNGAPLARLSFLRPYS